MAKFVAKRLEDRVRLSGLEDAQDLYKQYVTSRAWSRYKTEIDAILTADGYADIIVEV